MDLRERKYWIFDLDGTLTVAVHDFTAIRRELDLPPGKPILEELATLPAQAVMVGDYLYDLLAGRDAGTATVYLDPTATFEYAEYADVCVTRFDEIVSQVD